MSKTWPQGPSLILRRLQSLSGRAFDAPKPAPPGPGPAGTPRPAEPPLMSSADVVRALTWLRYAPANGRGRGRKTAIKAVAEAAGVNRVTLYRIIQTGQISEKSREALSPVLAMFETGAGLVPRPPDPHLPRQDKLVRASDWKEGSRCRNCGGIGFSPVIMNGTNWYFCDDCLPPTQYPAVGARAC
jgi:hypothetical protein